ncbi:hypothetical protein B0T22DRAFT_468597 [Podospora appendiculata]|uniref:Uncharacterized protein n=1 Tax=Podospora appendiculata TaxID=314037 RepID=A0AAE0X2M3_9PEZI|nr:hypothetical protein B0T22DRAFT_468597 [Podospora appendiculata]
MSGRKILTIGLVAVFGVTNAYYTFGPSLQELHQQRTSSDDLKTAPPQLPQPPIASEGEKADGFTEPLQAKKNQ